MTPNKTMTGTTKNKLVTVGVKDGESEFDLGSFDLMLVVVLGSEDETKYFLRPRDASNPNKQENNCVNQVNILDKGGTFKERSFNKSN